MPYRKFFTMSFDDGTVQDRRFVELLNCYGLKATFNLNSGLFGQVHTIVHDGISVCHDEIAAEEVKDLYAGHEVAVHTLTHPNLCKLSDEEVLHEVDDDRKNLEKLTGQSIIGMAYPGGPHYDDRIIGLIRAHTPLVYARTAYVCNDHSFHLPQDFMRWHPTCHPHDADVFPLLEQFKAMQPTDGDLLFYLWGHSFEFDKYQSWEELEKICKSIAFRGDISYVTNGEVYRYAQRYTRHV